MTLAIIFDSVGAGEWMVLLAVILVVMGPKRLPSTARKIGAYYSKFRRAADSFKRQLMEMDYEMERELKKAESEVESAMSVPEEAGSEKKEAGSGEQGAESGEQAVGSEEPEPATDYGDQLD